MRYDAMTARENLKIQQLVTKEIAKQKEMIDNLKAFKDILDSSAEFIGDKVLGNIQQINDSITYGTSFLTRSPGAYVEEGIWKDLLNKQTLHDEESLMECSWEFLSDDSDLVILQKAVCWSGYGDGYTIGDVNDEFEKELDQMSNWQLEESYDDMISKGLVTKLLDKEGRTIGLVGFNK